MVIEEALHLRGCLLNFVVAFAVISKFGSDVIVSLETLIILNVCVFKYLDMYAIVNWFVRVHLKEL